MQDTKTKILEAAQQLFAKNGIENTSLRQITSEANVNLAAINYHFGSKENLIRDVMWKFIKPLDDERNLIIENARSSDSGLQVKNIIEAYLKPWFAFRKEHPDFLGIYIRLFTKGERTKNAFRETVYELSKIAYNDFLKTLSDVLPYITQEQLKKRTSMAILAAASVLLDKWFAENLQRISGLHLSDEAITEYITRIIETGKCD